MYSRWKIVNLGFIRPEGREPKDWCSEIKAVDFENGILSTPDAREVSSKVRTE